MERRNVEDLEESKFREIKGRDGIVLITDIHLLDLPLREARRLIRLSKQVPFSVPSSSMGESTAL